jgi:heat shock protein HslJ
MTVRSIRRGASGIVLALFAAYAVGCSSSSSSPVGATAVTADRLAGTWTLMSMRPAGQLEQGTPPGASYTLTLADGRSSTRADCNVCSGSLVLAAQTVTIGPLLACTRAACATMAFENVYVAILAGDSTASRDGDALTLTSPRGVLRFRRG